MRAVRLPILIAACALTALPAAATARTAPNPGEVQVDASHLGGALVLCGQVTDYTAPDGVAADGALTVTGVSTPDPHTFVIDATATLSAGDSALLTGLAATDSFTCLSAIGDGMGVLVELEVAETAELCGAVAPSGTTWMITATGFPDLTTTLTGEAEVIVDNDVRLDDLLGWFDQFDNEACVTFGTDAAGVVDDIVLDGELVVCGPVADTSASSTYAVFEAGTGADLDLAVRPDIIGLGGIVLPASIFTDAALGIFELAHAAQAYPRFEGADSVCATIPVVATEILPSTVSASVALCGFPGSGARTVGLSDAASDWDWFAVLASALAGFPAEGFGASSPNLTQVFFLGIDGLRVCLAASVEGGAGSEVISTRSTISACVDVVVRSASAIGLRTVDGSAAEFELTAGSSVDATLVPGVRAAVDVRADRGADGPVTIERVADATCAGTTPVLPDTAVPSGPAWLTYAGVVLLALASAAAADTGRRGSARGRYAARR